MNAQQTQQFNDMIANVNTLMQFMKAIQNDRSMPNNLEGALRNRLFDISPLNKDVFTNTLTSTPGGVIVPKEPDGVIELNNGWFVVVYKKLI